MVEPGRSDRHGLSLCLVTRDSAAFVEPLLAGARAYADEIVIVVDAASTDATETICARYADHLFRLELPAPFVKTVAAWATQQCSGDWILRLDDDELPGAGLVESLPALMADRAITHYWTRRRWLVEADPGRWIAQHPWWPDWQLRLFRNLPSIVHMPTDLHGRTAVEGSARYVPRGCIYHLDFVYHTRAERRAKVERYERLLSTYNSRQFYLPPSGDQLATRPIPTDDAPWRGPSATRPRQLAHPRGVALPCALTHEHELPNDFFRAALTVDDCPADMPARTHVMVDVEVRNTSEFSWPGVGLGDPRVRLGYHWLYPNGETHERGGIRADLPHTLDPGQSTLVPSPVLSPSTVGTYVLGWDLVIENVAWFSQHGLVSPEFTVTVGADRDGESASRRA
jgi:hypothetical protein